MGDTLSTAVKSRDLVLGACFAEAKGIYDQHKSENFHRDPTTNVVAGNVRNKRSFGKS